MKLFIVESPGKIKTIQKILPSDFIVKASVGHCFQIERTDRGIDVNNNYKVRYVPISGKSKVIEELKKLSKEAEEVYIATDNDREGESIGAHIADRIIKDPSKIRRVVFQEITKSAILKAIQHPTDINRDMYNAQQARSVLDMLVGFKVSPILWQKIMSGTSAGRVQSIGLRYVVEKQREIDSFIPKEYWTIEGDFNGDLIANYSAEMKNEKEKNECIVLINAAKKWLVKNIESDKKSRIPFPVFTTSSMQQFCSTTYGWSGKKTMEVAQKLYELGKCTYHRTDSVNISVEALTEVRELISNEYGNKYLPKNPRAFKNKNANAQEAHEGIRPTHLDFSVDMARGELGSDEFKLYNAIYRRFVACQMEDAVFNHSKITIESDNKQVFTANGQTCDFDGFLKVYTFSNAKETILPNFKKNEEVKLLGIKDEQHFTKPPAQYNDASLVKVLEEEGIGRPSTYATIIDTLIKREYVKKDGKAFRPTDLGCKVCDFLVANFQELMDKKYTARIEEQLDEIANGDKVWQYVVDGFFTEIKKRIDGARKADSMKEAVETEIICPTCQKNKLVKRSGRYGEFYGCAGYMIKGKGKCSAIFKIGQNGEPVIQEKKEVEYLEGKVCDKCGSKIIVRTATKTGKKFGGCSKFPKCKRMFSLEGEPIEMKKTFKGKG